MSTKRETDFLLHDYIFHTNKLQPYSKEIGYNEYPKQQEDVGETMTLKYRYRNIPEFTTDDIEVHRPEDDTEYYKPKQFTDEEEDNLMEDDMIILRHDEPECFEAKLIAISQDFRKILCIRTDQVSDYDTDCFIYPNQMTELMGLLVEPQYVGNLESPREAYVICAAVNEPMYIIVIEYISDTEYRVLTGDEVQFRIPSLEPEWYINKEGERVVRPKEPLPYKYYNDMQIGTLRKELMENRVPYKGE